MASRALRFKASQGVEGSLAINSGWVEVEGLGGERFDELKVRLMPVGCRSSCSDRLCHARIEAGSSHFN